MGVTRNALAGLGFDQDAPMVVFPIAPFLVDSDLEPVRARLDEVEAGLTAWKPASDRLGVQTPPPVTVEANGYEAAYDRVNTLFLANAWGDGLPLVAPTAERVARTLRGSDRPADAVVGKVMPRGGIATVETLAVALTMAGGRPEHLPLLLAAVEAILDPALDHDKFQATSGSTFPVVVVNGPVAEEARLNSGFGLLGPDPRHPAGATVGRALRLVLQNVGGALPGTGSMAIFGGMRYTNAVFAEDEAGLPPGWEPVSVEHGGMARGANAVTVFVATSASNVMRRGIGKETLIDEAEQSLERVARYLCAPNGHYGRNHADGTPGALLMPSVVARQLTELGWTSKQAVRERLWASSHIPRQVLRETGIWQWIEAEPTAEAKASLALDPWPICARPEQILLVVAGGAHPTHNFWMQSWGSRVVSRPIELPACWNLLIAEADAELGPRGDVCRI
ncbi:MAG: hypothetical protein H6983_03100 [Ectothiorhodospiraceae bacterium]|nr:hypothetical protein [Ectothiorhodospiraceae bacterium]